MARIEVEVVIRRPVDAVFTYINDATHATKWNPDVIEAHASEVPMRMGSSLTVVRKLLGRRVEATYEVKEFEPNKRVASRTDRPVPNELTFTFQQVDGGTRMRFATESDLRGLWKLAWPILRGKYKKQMHGNLDALKAILEAQDPQQTNE